MRKISLFLSLTLLIFICNEVLGQNGLLGSKNTSFTRADSLRGNINNPERTWWDIQHYDITVTPDYQKHSIVGTNKITYKVVKDSYPAFMQIDLQEPMILDSVLFGGTRKLNFTRDGNAFHVNVPKQPLGAESFVTIYYHGNPRIAKKAPWDGGWIFTKDSLGRPWMTVACQGLGASVWYPCKDVQDDEPDHGETLTMIVADSLTAVANGRKKAEKYLDGRLKAVTWEVVNPINNYTITPYIGKYEPIKETYKGLKGNLDITLWALDYNIPKMREHCQPDVFRMLKAFEYWFGPYPFYEDGYQLVDAPHLGMEHQSAVAYGNRYLNGYLGRSLSGTDIGLKWDYIIVHESGHEWFANNITSKDIADMWIHESFTDYSETLFIDYYYGRQEGQEYCYGLRKNIQNDKPIIGPYGVNQEGSGDMYYKGANMINSIRNAIGNDEKFRTILIGLNKTFYHKTVISKDVEDYISQNSGIDFSKVFDQYLRTIQIPVLEYALSEDQSKIYYRYTNCIAGFHMPMTIKAFKGNTIVKLEPNESWQTLKLSRFQTRLISPVNIESQYYLTTKKVPIPEM